MSLTASSTKWRKGNLKQSQGYGYYVYTDIYKYLCNYFIWILRVNIQELFVFGENVLNLLLIYLCKIVCDFYLCLCHPIFFHLLLLKRISLFPNSQLDFVPLVDTTMCHPPIHRRLCVEVLLFKLIQHDSTLQWLENYVEFSLIEKKKTVSSVC